MMLIVHGRRTNGWHGNGEVACESRTDGNMNVSAGWGGGGCEPVKC